MSTLKDLTEATKADRVWWWQTDDQGYGSGRWEASLAGHRVELIASDGHSVLVFDGQAILASPDLVAAVALHAAAAPGTDALIEFRLGDALRIATGHPA